MRRDAACVFLLKDGKFLAQHRDSAAPTYPGTWGIFGGGIEPGETPKEAALREIQEELNYKIPATQLKFLTKAAYVNKTYDRKGTTHFFIAPFPGFDKIKQDEGDYCELMTPEQALKVWKIPEDMEGLKALAALTQAP